MAKRDKNATADLGLRVKEPLRRQIEQAANANGVSMNAEIVKRLEHSFRSEQRSLLSALMHASLFGKALKWETPEHGREMTFSPEAKAQMKERISVFIDSLPEREQQLHLSEEELQAASKLLDEYNSRRKIGK